MNVCKSSAVCVTSALLVAFSGVAALVGAATESKATIVAATIGMGIAAFMNMGLIHWRKSANQVHEHGGAPAHNDQMAHQPMC